MIINCYYYKFELDERKIGNFTILINGELVKLTKKILLDYEKGPLGDYSITQRLACLFGSYLKKIKYLNLI
jgi:hypothetical protein